MRQLFCVLGDPVAHSRSPAIHARAFALLGLDAVYAPCHVAHEDLPAAVYGLRALGASGFNVTVPHKASVARLCDRLSPAAELAGAVNCVAREVAPGWLASQASGARPAALSLASQASRPVSWVGHNTDGAGLLRSLRGRGISLEGKRAVVLGAGGAARAAAMALAGQASEVNVVNRDVAKAKTLSLQLRAAGTKSRAAALGADEMHTLLREAELVMQCSTVGMNSAEAIIDAGLLGQSCAVVDLVYAGAPGSPLGDTALLVAARARGLAVVDGLDVLVHQAIASLEIWLAKSGLDGLPGLFDELRLAALNAGHD